jgi:hypothetical protein
MSINRNRAADNFVDEIFLVVLGFILFRDATLLAFGFVAAILTNSVSFSDASPELFVVEKGGQFVALPLVRRSIPGTAYFYCTSAYSYAGPITNCSVEHEQELFKKFREEVLNYLQSQNIVSALSRIRCADSLFEFKSGFSHLRFQFATWRLVVNEEVYCRLSSRAPKNTSSGQEHFPLYRG